jgi:tetraacyldisaccharide 4'-kinase
MGIGANRYEMGSRLLNARPADNAKTGTPDVTPDVIVLDDGFQHLALERDVDLVLVDATDPFGGGRMLPLGRLREPASSLNRAAAILLTRAEPGRSYAELEEKLRLLNPNAPIFRSWTRPLAAVEVSTGSEWPLADLADKRILAFCGLGNPESFWRVLRREGLGLVERLGFRDHHHYNQMDLERIALTAAARRADLVLTTEKDLVNLTGALDPSMASTGEIAKALRDSFANLPLCWLKIETVVEQGEELIGWIEERMSRRVGAPARDSVAQSV